MRYSRLLCVFLAATFAFSLMAKKPKDKNKYGVYVAGVSASFKDSLVYFTNVQFVDSAALNGTGFLVERSQYSEQLRDFMERVEGSKDRTCFVLFSTKEKNLVKDLQKLRQKYAKGGTVLVKGVNPAFKFEKAKIY